MVIIPAGSFRMGCLKEDLTCESSELPVHEVRFERPFALSATEVTWAQWDSCVKAYVCTHLYDHNAFIDDSRDRPLTLLDGVLANDYLVWLSSETGETYRLPSEAEWEYAARAGTTTRFPWGDELGVNRAHCNGCGSPQPVINTVPVGSFDPNAWGLYDVVGNVSEYTGDCWHDNYENAPSDGSVWSDVHCIRGVERGGSYLSTARDLRVARRQLGSLAPNTLGIRVLREIAP